ncbi:hypothetical protein JXO52_02475 [bacterium]|nr:hypothetical protein [bacterium]
MRTVRMIVAIACLLTASLLQGQEIVKRVKNYVLIDMDSSSGCLPGEELTVLRRISEVRVLNIGRIEIIKYAQGQCAARVTAQRQGVIIGIGDFVQLPERQEPARADRTVNAKPAKEQAVKKQVHADQQPRTVSQAPSGAGEPGSIGIERGDKEVSFMGFYSKIVGTDFDMGGIGSFNLGGGYFFTRNLQLGAETQVLIYPGFMGGTDVIFSFSLYGSYNFQTGSKFIPYVTAKWYQDEVVPGDDLLEDAYFTIGGGFRNFFNEYAALNTSITYGFSLGGTGERVLTIMGGVSVIF